MNDIQKTTKISTKIDRRILKSFEEKIEAACLRRDSFLNRVLEDELTHLDEEIAGNSPEAQQFIAGRLDQLVRKQVSLALRSDLVERLNDICERKRIVRDAFFNRLFFLLACSSDEINRLFFDGSSEWRYGAEYYDGYRARERLRDHLAPVKDVFWAIRAGLECREEDRIFRLGSEKLAEDYAFHSGLEGLEDINPVERHEKVMRLGREKDAKDGGQFPGGIYSTVWGDPENKKSALFALNCYLPNEMVPDHPDQLALRERAEDLLASLVGD
ncbi:MAG: hypothetical protein FWD64_12395 [Acidobacteriaceae bacterium]|nr:hypothetical protein [Acidobacteriaceae bacterium]